MSDILKHKKVWETPKLRMEHFVADSYVAACDISLVKLAIPPKYNMNSYANAPWYSDGDSDARTFGYVSVSELNTRYPGINVYLSQNYINPKTLASVSNEVRFDWSRVSSYQNSATVYLDLNGDGKFDSGEAFTVPGVTVLSDGKVILGELSKYTYMGKKMS